MNSPRLAIALLVTLPLPVLAGVVLHATSQDSSGPSVIELDGKKMRAEQGDKRRLMIFDGDAQRLYMAEPDKKVYQVVDEASARAQGEQLRSQMSNLPPAIREKMRAAGMGAGAPAPAATHVYKLEKTGESATVIDRPCEFYRVLRDGKPMDASNEMCLIPWGGSLRKSDFVAWHEMGKFSEHVLSSFMAGMGRSTSSAMGGSFFGAWFEDSPGVPGESVKVDSSGKRKVVWALTSVEHRSLPASDFVPPADYREESMMPGGSHRP